MAQETDHIASLLGLQAPQADDDYGNDNMDDLPGGSVEDPSGAASEPPTTVQDDGLPDVPVTGKRNQKVPLSALQEERTRRQELNDQLAQERASRQQLEQRTNILLQQFAQMQQQQQTPLPPEKPALPSFTEDPEAYVNALKAQFESELNDLRQARDQAVQQTQANQHGQQIAGWAAQQEQDFTRTTADYPAAADFFYQRKQAEYAALGADPVAIQEQIRRDYIGVVQMAANRGQNPAALLYALSGAMGYTKGTQAPAQAVKPQQQPRKTPPTSLGNMGSAAQQPDDEGELTVEKLNQMSDAEFDKLWKKMSQGSGQFPKF